MSGKIGIAALLTVTIAGSVAGQGAAKATSDKDIMQTIGTLRSLPDAKRAVVTKDLAQQILKMPPSETKLGDALSLSNLATEGDFGRDTLQAVTDALATAVKEMPNAKPEYKEMAYGELAQLYRYEHMRIDVSGRPFQDALAKLDTIDDARGKADFTLTDLSGTSWTLSQLRGKVVLVNFWATWCPPCRKEMPDLDALYQRFKSKGFVILAISDEDMSKVKPFIDAHKYTYNFLLDPGRKVNTLYHVEGIPKSFVYDRHGKLVAQTIDMRTQRQFLDLLARAGLK